MKRLLGTDVPGSYTFNPAAKTVTFSGLSYTLTLANILLITNVKANTIIYNFADASTGETSFNNNVLTLTYDTSSMSATDTLQIYLDLESYEESLAALLRRMNKLLESNAVVDSALRQRITIAGVDSSGTTTTLSGTVPISGTVSFSTSSNTTYPGTTITTGLSIIETPVDQRWRIVDDSRNCYANMIRRNLVFS